MAASLKYYKDQIESAIADARANGYDVDVTDGCCGQCGPTLRIWEPGYFEETFQEVEIHG